MKSCCVVPVTAETVTVVWLLLISDDEDCRQTTVVPLAHDDVPQSAPAMAAVGVMSKEAKLKPLMVALAPPVPGALPLPTRMNDTVGATTHGSSNQWGHMTKWLRGEGKTHNHRRT